ncbi:23S rRNA (adenine(2503)-C(2))-methyltransferase [Candidatus Falkowbacteria bacterium RIFOXYB2_FULL_47_14]|uniref:Probable dual-specificity RNA methyltransferase RlmN n=1 Tax=Candidatus Falkowbacteria bacterium RIFOXYA2_FULL_47_19 TaxID=1797994 RepID=A0A1F5SHP7_9BACT|nr:MAG: 23S rRNA (adenine(2503)-C(2))-methyltransferase [Candidatus Falkowbacteria bacterium RIFOXYA2_FULL_47_19]OGF34514.1 MAG: 23S rRNA (adenine(2503)-C(2))-methyltransferase [Candidatus Falkowbacteria bacterium RIFOXYC2_FULL_46_15]OGF43031.1 MAG: 23S rRNA (adenine(2503)-C(2))-methyltransferase [Candidatus Falkowbacteria bacterium RIFOXYB2_FULL_47_14]
MDLYKLQTILKGEPPYRFKQARKAVFSDLAEDWSEVTSLPLGLREKLNADCPLRIEGKISGSKNSRTQKALISFDEGQGIETVLMRHGDGRRTLCVSSQIGCPIACAFCATGQMGFKRNLSVSEIIDQYLFFARHLKKEPGSPKITNIVFMGMGEPFLNYDNLLSSIKIINDPETIGLGARHISVSTVGIIDKIRRFAKENIQANLAVSLHAPDDGLRSRLIPINRKYPIRNILAAVDYYIDKTSRRVMFEYMLIKGVNDSPAEARQLAIIMRKPLYLVNLINYNPTGEFRPAEREAAEKFKIILKKEKVAVTERASFGIDIEAACGQLAGRSGADQ